MLHEFLRTIRDGDPKSLLEISWTLNIPPDMALQMANELAGKGYLKEIGADCSAPRAACSDCPAGRDCRVLPRHWILTEKGKTAVSGAAWAE
jgi:hypothetical protein